MSLFKISLQKQIDKKLNSYCKSFEATLLKDISIEYQKQTYKFSHILMSTYGTIIIDLLDYDGEIYGTENEKIWLNVTAKPAMRNNFNNPIDEFNKKTASYRSFMSENNVRSGKVKSFIVVNDNVVLNTSKKLNILNLTEFLRLIKTGEYILDNNYDYKKAIDLLEKSK